MTWVVDPAVAVCPSEKAIFVPSLKTVRVVPLGTTTDVPPPADDMVNVNEVADGIALRTIHDPPTVDGI